MPPVDKAKAAGVSVTSFFDLKAELAKKSDEFARTKTVGGSKHVPGEGRTRPDKKPTVWARSNKGVHGRAARDIEIEAVSKVTVESARAALERKAKVYEKLMKGKSGGLSEKQYEALLVDDDPVIEYEDEFGRLRTGRRSEVPRHLLHKSQDEEEDVDDGDVIHNPVNFFPVYEPSAERIKAVQDELAEPDNPLSSHYDASKEVRAKGAAFYQFSGDEETRKKQLEELRTAREETKMTREDLGAMDVRPGDVEGMREESGQSTSRALEKRKREIEERRALLEAKRKKTKVIPERDGISSGSVTLPVTFVANDPFVALEKKVVASTSRTPEAPQTHTAKSEHPGADAFLAQLEQDMLKKR
ncbi:hypothetical protein JVT61DRAFT_4522 [Boletus reticuloceps]|uniref:Uncharacterized protein n=1 Tax=Boletus reticuloceps TaxID=495285 RepID=A0A8I2YL52_9AGAM|nr:hypothetical protein JVT61DRAFT_4522 [Boletus reticuloceps]